ncbi:hypothetical protein EK904_013255 [Melospiza melodia maxima]|nr:hypothetical protein EK904_013255 [Melospiza melodia maxima]
MICCLFCCSGRLVSPKWKNFKGLKLQWRDKIRLNNAIWRAWYMQYLEKRKNPVCHFVTPLDGSVDVDEHRRPEVCGKAWEQPRSSAAWNRIFWSAGNKGSIANLCSGVI